MSMKPTPSFEKWFGASKVVDAAGAPLVVFHGTSAQFDVFDADRQGQTAGVDGGFFFTSSREVANDAYGWREGGHVKEVYLSAKKILGLQQYFALTGKDEDVETDGGRDAPVNYFDRNSDEIVEFAQEHGFDGIWWPADPDSRLDHDLIVVFSPAQIKSANNNNGDFDATNKDIRFSLVDQVEKIDLEAPCP